MPRLADVIGQPGLVTLLARLIAAGRLPHAVMLEGIPGCGRRTLARATAQALLCPQAAGGDACGACASCRMTAEGTHPDLVAVAHDSESDDLSVDSLRDDVVARAHESALIGERRAFLLYGVERLRDASANVMLKVLEEPPAGAYFIMTTAQSSAVLKTIRSRAQTYRLHPLAAEDLGRILSQGGIPSEQAAARAMRSAGSHRGLWEDLESVPLADLRSLCLEGHRSETVARVMASLPAKLTPEQEEAGRTLSSEQRRAVRQWLTALSHDLQRDLRARPSAELADRIEGLSRLHRDLDRNLAPRLVIEALALDQERRGRSA